MQYSLEPLSFQEQTRKTEQTAQTVSQPIHVASPVYICVYPLYITDVPREVMYTGTN